MFAWYSKIFIIIFKIFTDVCQERVRVEGRLEGSTAEKPLIVGSALLYWGSRVILEGLRVFRKEGRIIYPPATPPIVDPPTRERHRLVVSTHSYHFWFFLWYASSISWLHSLNFYAFICFSSAAHTDSSDNTKQDTKAKSYRFATGKDFGRQRRRRSYGSLNKRPKEKCE